ncbi:Beta-galactosidase BgaA [compost metagenome]
MHAQAYTNKSYKDNRFLFGVCYYPEHWNEVMWEEDFCRMAEMGFNVVRMAETAWNVIEPEEGRYDFSLFDRAIERCLHFGLSVILGTPTYAPPAWLTEKYPEVLRVNFHGQAMAHGSRRHYNYSSPEYLRLCRNMVTALAEHYKNNPAVIGWQIDNELNCHSDMSFAESDHIAFRQWCKDKYVTLAALNDAWGTAFWAQTYTDFSQVYLPRPTVTFHNPSHLLDFLRFTSESAIRFAELQYKLLKEKCGQQFVTHNGIFGNIDYNSFTDRAVDFLSYDSYPAFQLARKDLPVKEKDKLSGKHLSRVRGHSAKFLILEQQAGPGGQTGNILNDDRDDYLLATPKPGQMRLWTWQSIAHGADGLLYFRWRTCPYGAETLWHGLNDYGNGPNRRLREAAKLGVEIHRLSPLLLSTSVTASAAILYDYDNDSNCKIDRHTGSAYWKSEEHIYLALNERHIGVDMLDMSSLRKSAIMKRYGIVFLPNAQLLNDEEVQPLMDFVENGGTLVLGPRSGYKDRNNHAHMLPFPGPVRSMTGIRIEEFTMRDREEESCIHFAGSNRLAKGPLYYEVLEAEAEDVQVLAEYTDDYYAGGPAITARMLGKGKVVYYGTFFTVDNVYELLDALEIVDPSSEWGEIPSTVETVYRTDGVNHYLFLLNYSSESFTISLKQPVYDLLSETRESHFLTLQPYGVSLLQKLA